MSASLQFKLNGVNVPAPIEWQDIQIEANFINKSDEGLTQSIQPNITIEKFVFVNEAAKLIRDYISGGSDLSTSGIFEGFPFEIIAFDAFNNQVVFDGVLDLTDEYREIHTAKVECKIKRVSGLNTFSERAEAISYGFLNSAKIQKQPGGIPDSLFENLSYVVEKKLEPEKLLLSGIILFVLVIELIDAIFELQKAIAEIIAIAASGFTGPAAAIIFAIAIAALQAIKIIALIIAIKKLSQEMIAQLISPVRRHKVIKFKTMLEKGAEYLGFGFDTGIVELDFLKYLPSKPDEEEPLQKGIPRPDDFGYTIAEAYDLAKRCFNAKVAIINDVVVLRSLNDPFWQQQSTYEMVDLDLQEKSFNTNEFFANRLINFLTDPVDWWTIDNFKGTNYEVIATEIKRNDKKNVVVKGLDNVQIPVALGNDKEGLNPVEESVRLAASAVDDIINFFGGRSNLASKVTARIGMLKTTENVHTVSKLIYQVNGKIPRNHRTDKFSAKILYDKYHNERSFVDNNFGGQYELHKNVKVPFGFNNFIEVINSSLFKTWDNRDGNIDSFKWNMAGDFAEMDFRIQKIYTKNLEEVTVEAE